MPNSNVRAMCGSPVFFTKNGTTHKLHLGLRHRAEEVVECVLHTRSEEAVVAMGSIVANIWHGLDKEHKHLFTCRAGRLGGLTVARISMPRNGFATLDECAQAILQDTVVPVLEHAGHKIQKH